MADAPDTDRRQFPRIPLLTEVWIVSGADREHGQSFDLSRGGLCLVDEKNRFDIGDEVSLELRLPDTDGPILTLSRVMWKSPDKAGLMFTDLADETRDHIDAICEKAINELRSFEDEKTPDRT